MNLSDLNKEQRLAAETLEGPLLVLAGAGSGKTRALTFRIANLLSKGVPPWSIMAITFTNKAAAEMRERIQSLAGEGGADVWVSTFHSGCAKILRRDIEKLGYTRSFTIYDDDDQISVIKDILKKQNIDEKYLPPREIKGKISDAKNKFLSPQEWFDQSSRDYRCQMIFDVYRTYEERIKSSNALDFDDLIVKTLELFTMHPPVLEAYQRKIRYIHVDEYQDTNYAQYTLIKLLAQENRNLCVVGDDDQSIYGWRGADIRNILDFEKDFPDTKVIKLEQNYRSTANILDAANQVIAVNENRKDKALWTEANPGDPIYLYRAGDERDEAAFICKQINACRDKGEEISDFAVLYRTNAQSRVIEESFVKTGIKYRMYGGLKFYDRKEIKDILAYLRVVINPADDVSVRRIINVPKRAIGETTITELVRCASEENVPLLTVCMEGPQSISSRAQKNVEKFTELIMNLTILSETMGVTEFVQYVVDTVGLENQYAKEESDEARARVENIREFIGAVKEYEQTAENPSVADYLENVALVSDLDQMNDGNGAVTMMTLHSAKGLEFPNVFMVGMEENLFPSLRSKDDQDRMEEERRLCYVGITRAKKKLYISFASRRMLYNQIQFNDRSRFIDDIPERLLKGISFTSNSAVTKKNADIATSWKRNDWHTKFRGNSESESNSWKPRTQFGDMHLNGKRSSLNNWSKNASLKSGTDNNMPNCVQQRFSHGAKIVESQARAYKTDADYQAGDHIKHPKFGRGVVIRVSGSGKDGRILIRFDDTQFGIKELALAIAPIVKLED